MWLGIVVKYVIVEDRLQESSRLKWQDAKMSKLEYCIANISPQTWPQKKGKNAKTYPLGSRYPQ